MIKKLIQSKITKFDDNGNKIQKGNCYGTCMAMILEKNIHDIPEFEELPNDGSWFRLSFTYLDSIGYDFDIIHCRNINEYPKGYSIANGPSPRGNWNHSVVYLDGELYHDPYPGGNGIDKVDYFLLLKKSNET